MEPGGGTDAFERIDIFEGSDLCNLWREFVESFGELPVSFTGVIWGGISGTEPGAPSAA